MTDEHSERKDWVIRIGNFGPFPTQRELTAASVKIFDDFVPAGQTKNLRELTNRRDFSKEHTVQYESMIHSAHLLNNMAILEALGVGADYGWLTHEDGPLVKLGKSIGLEGCPQCLDGLMESMALGVKQAISNHRQALNMDRM